MSIPPKHWKRLPKIAKLALLRYYELSEDIHAEKIFTMVMHKPRSLERAQTNRGIIDRVGRLRQLSDFIRKYIYVKDIK